MTSAELLALKPSDDIVFILQLEITEFIPTLLYFGYTFLMVVTFWILTGTAP
jgi:uncharacterized membrane protein